MVFAVAYRYDIPAFGDLFIDGFLRVEIIPGLVDVGHLDGLPDLDRSGVRGLLSSDHSDEGCLAYPVGSGHADHLARGDLEIDAHHTVEDVGIALGEVFAEALGDKAGVRRFASIKVPLDEALVDVALDLSGRPFLHYAVDFPGQKILGDPPFDPQLVEEFWRAFAVAARLTLHIELVRGRNTHHIVEAGFKAVARTLRDAVRIDGGGVPSTKGSL